MIGFPPSTRFTAIAGASGAPRSTRTIRESGTAAT